MGNNRSFELAITHVKSAIDQMRHHNRSRGHYGLAIIHIRRAMAHAPCAGIPASERAPLFRMLNWLRADLKKLTKENA